MPTKKAEPKLPFDVIDADELAQILRISAASIPSMRSRDPASLPPPFMRRPLRWRHEAVLEWMKLREDQERERIARDYSMLQAAKLRHAEAGPKKGNRQRTRRVHQVCVLHRVPAMRGMQLRFERSHRQNLLPGQWLGSARFDLSRAGDRPFSLSVLRHRELPRMS